jgi:predicted nucleotidyltransferase
MGRFTELREEFEKLLGVPVDLVMATTFRNPYFRDSVEKSRRLLYAA